MAHPRSGVIEIPPADHHFVYRVYCRCGDLLYVGVTGDMLRRMAAHYRDRHRWTRGAVRIEYDVYDDRTVAERAERRAIIVLQPIYNITHGRKGAVADLPWPTFPVQLTPDQRAVRAYRQLQPFAGI